jgi:glucose-6-phosphate 1-dehydrogenase
MNEFKTPAPTAVVIFGVTGDLASRKLLPALYRLLRDGRMPQRFSIIGFARRDWSQEQFAQVARDALENSKEIGEFDEGIWQTFSASLQYIQSEFGDAGGYHRLQLALNRLELHNHLFYLSTPPSQYEAIAQNLGQVGLGRSAMADNRIIIEKPFGTNLETALALNAVLHAYFDEEQIYRIDHFLGKETVQNLLALRFANSIFEPLWNRNYVDHVQITVAEDLGLEGRGAFYEEAGILRDMIQNHVMQLLCLTAMEPPVSSWHGNTHPLEAKALRDEKVKVIRALRPITTDQCADCAVLGQYTAGKVGGAEVPGYRQEEKVAPDSSTPTFAAIRVEIDNWRWAGVPFLLRSGKRLPKKSTEIALIFKRPPLAMFPDTEPNVLVLNIQPDEGISLRFGAKVPGLETKLRTVDMDFSYKDFGSSGPTAYERLILDAMLGDPSLFPREDEVEASWAWIEPILNATLEPQPYKASTWGPSVANRLLGRLSDFGRAQRQWRTL